MEALAAVVYVVIGLIVLGAIWEGIRNYGQTDNLDQAPHLRKPGDPGRYRPPSRPPVGMSGEEASHWVHEQWAAQTRGGRKVR
jgi:hypothetical protein